MPALQKGAFDARSVQDDQVYLRVLERDAAPGELEAWDEVAGDLVAVLGIDHPDHVETFVGGRPVAELGGWASVRETGLRKHPIEDLSVIPALQTMLGLAADQSRRPGGLIEQVTRRSEDGSVAVMATGRFGRSSTSSTWVRPRPDPGRCYGRRP